MAKPKKKKGDKSESSRIAVNKRARHDYLIEDTLEAGMELMGWEVKSMRAGRVQLSESYVFLRNGEAWLFGCHVTPLLSASTHVVAKPMRDRKLLLHRAEINKLVGQVDRKGYTVVPLKLYWKRSKVKLEIGLGKGKKTHDKRASEKARDWDRTLKSRSRRCPHLPCTSIPTNLVELLKIITMRFQSISTGLHNTERWMISCIK